MILRFGHMKLRNPVVRPEIYAYANNGNVRGFFRTVTLQDGDATNTESMSVNSIALVNENTLSTNMFHLLHLEL